MSRARRRPPPENLRILRDRSVSFPAATILLESITWKQTEQRHLDYLSRYESVPPATVDWIMSLPAQDRMRLRIATNSTLDRHVAQTKDWTRFKGRRHLITGTFMVLPPIGRPLPGGITFMGREEESGTVRHIFQTKDYKGLEDVALAFDGCEIKRKRINGNEYAFYSPKGEVTILEGYFQDGWWYENRYHPDIICPRGESRRIRRYYSGPWFGPIVRSAFKLRALDSQIMPPLGDEANTTQKRTLYIGWDFVRSRFGVLLELPKGEPSVKLLPPSRCGKPPEGPALLEREQRIAMRELIAHRTKAFIFSPKSVAGLPAHELVPGFHGIGEAGPALAEQVRDIVSMTTDWIYMQSGVHYTIEDWHRTYTRLCDALGVPRRFKGLP